MSGLKGTCYLLKGGSKLDSLEWLEMQPIMQQTVLLVELLFIVKLKYSHSQKLRLDWR